ncbi:MAG: M20 family metallopeptidase [Marinosulfonomonas sp.]|nr:M20 family metallopeptidase [Marinosulfonomonas sp.]
MPIVNRIAEFSKDMQGWRRHLHQHPELGFECHETAAFVAERLREFGVDEIHQGIATSGIVAIINGQGAGPTIGLRADMDALPMGEETGLEYASVVDGKMHACGHDGHTTMLLGAARYLAETRNFSGRVALIFQPAEEDGGGGEVMCDEGIMDTFDIGEVYALHNIPDLPVGTFSTTPGPIMAAADDFEINIKGLGGHGAYPQETRDPVVAVIALASAFQTIVSRNHDTRKMMVVSVTQIHTGSASNVIPEVAVVGGTVRTFDKDVKEMAKRRLREICRGIAETYDVEVALTYNDGYPPTINDADKVALAAAVAAEVSGVDNVVADQDSEMGAEDFSYMLEKRPGAYLFLGQGAGPGVHNTGYDFNDEISPIGASFFVRLVETRQPVGNGG